MKNIIILLLSLFILSCSNCTEESLNAITYDMTRTYPLGSKIIIKINGQHGIISGYDCNCSNKKIKISTISPGGFNQIWDLFPYEFDVVNEYSDL